MIVFVEREMETEIPYWARQCTVTWVNLVRCPSQKNQWCLLVLHKRPLSGRQYLPKGCVLLKNASSCLNGLTTKRFLGKMIPPSPDLQTRLFFRAAWGVLKARGSSGAISVELMAGGGVVLSETAG